MARKRRRRVSRMPSMARAGMGFVSGGVSLGVGSQVLGSIGGAPATSAQTAVGNLASFYPVMGTVAGAGATLKELKKLNKRR